MKIDRIDHLVLTVRDLAATLDFYTRVLGREEVRFGAGRTALRFGRHKINLHEKGREFEPRAATATPGSADFCLIAATPLDPVGRRLGGGGGAVALGPVRPPGAAGPIDSVYLRDPDGNLVEISTYDVAPGGEDLGG